MTCWLCDESDGATLSRFAFVIDDAENDAVERWAAAQSDEPVGVK